MTGLGLDTDLADAPIDVEDTQDPAPLELEPTPFVDNEQAVTVDVESVTPVDHEKADGVDVEPAPVGAPTDLPPSESVEVEVPEAQEEAYTFGGAPDGAVVAGTPELAVEADPEGETPVHKETAGVHP